MRFRAGVILTTSIVCVAALGPSVEAADTIIEITVGQDATLDVLQLNYALERPCAHLDCVADVTGGLARAVAERVDATGSSTGERGVGWRFVLTRACADQSLLADMRLEYDFGYEYASTAPPALGSAAAATHVYADETGTASTASTPGSSGNASHATTAAVRIDDPYEAIIAANASATLTDTPVPGESAQASATVRPASLSVVFDDDTPPVLETVRLHPEGREASGAFLGYAASPVSLGARARDPSATSTGTPIAQACVAEIRFSSGGNVWVVPVDYAQSEVTTGTWTEEGRHLVGISARDHAGKSAPLSSYSFVLDMTAPETAAAVDREANGLAGWYANATPRWDVECLESGTDSAPCHTVQTSRDGGATWVDHPGAQHLLDTGEGHDLTLRARSIDAAGNVGPAVEAGPIDVDATPPDARLWANTSSPFGNGWYRAPTQLGFECVSDATSGCSVVQTSTDDGASWQDVGTHACATERDSVIRYRIPDVAGNEVAGSVRFGCDMTAPPATVPGMTSGVYQNPYDGITYSNVTPIIRWDVVADPFIEGVSSGLRHYELEHDGAVTLVPPSSTERALVGAAEGWSCARVRAVDNAGNRAPWSPELCVFVDRIAPASGFIAPAPNSLVFYGEPIQLDPSIEPMPSYVENGVVHDMDAVVVGPILTGIRSEDNGSKLQAMHLVEDLPPFYDPNAEGAYMGPASFDPAPGEDRRWDNNGTAPCEMLFISIHTCAWLDAAEHPTSTSVTPRLLFGRTWDNANNLNITTRNYLRIDAGLVEVACTALVGACTNVLFRPLTEMVSDVRAEDFLRYAVYAAPEGQAIDPLDPLQLVGFSTSVTDTRVEDAAHRQHGTAYHYRIVVELRDGSAIHDAYPEPEITFRDRVGHLNAAWLASQLD